jgi:hypothetical protein
LRRARGRSRGFVGPAAHQDHHRSTSGELQSIPAIVASGCLAITRATARKFWRLRIGPQLEPLGKDCRRARTRLDPRYPGVPSQDDDVSVPSSRGETTAVVAFNPSEWYAFSDHDPIVATFEDCEPEHERRRACPSSKNPSGTGGRWTDPG